MLRRTLTTVTSSLHHPSSAISHRPNIVAPLLLTATSHILPLHRTFSSKAAQAAGLPARPPSRVTLLGTYRRLHRALFQTFFSASQYATFSEASSDGVAISGVPAGGAAAWRKAAFAKEENRPHVEFAEKRVKRWREQLKQTYRSAVAKGDSAAIIRAHHHAEQYLTLLISNMEHSRYLLEGGWGIRRNQVQQLTNVAHKVGLQMPKETAPLTWVPAGAKHQKARDAILNKHDKFTK